MRGGAGVVVAAALLVLVVAQESIGPPATPLPPDQRVAGSLCSVPGCHCAADTQPPGASLLLLCSCHHTQDKELHLSREAPVPEDIWSVVVSGCQRVLVLSGAFPQRHNLRQHQLRSLRLQEVAQVEVQADAFLHLPHLRNVSFQDCRHLRLARGAFQVLHQDCQLQVRGADSVRIEGHAFSWMRSFTFAQVKNLSLDSAAFALHSETVSSLEASWEVSIEDSELQEVPAQAFPTSAREVRLQRCVVGRVRGAAFSPLALQLLDLQNCSVGALESGALSERTHLRRLLLRGTSVRRLESGAVLSGVDLLEVEGSRLALVAPGAVRATVVRARMHDCTVEEAGASALALSDWSRLEVSGTRWLRLAPGALAGLRPAPGGPVALALADNVFGVGAQASSLHLPLSGAHQLDASVSGNRFQVPCQCDAGAWLRELCAPPDGRQDDDVTWFLLLFNSSWCQMDRSLALCLGMEVLPDDDESSSSAFVALANHSALVCGGASQELQDCQAEAAAAASEEPVDQDDEVGPGAALELDASKHVLLVIFLAVVCTLFVAGTAVVALYARRRNAQHLTKRRMVLEAKPAPAAPATTTLRQDNQQEDEEDEDEEARADKAVQTLPDQLTAELLQSLRERLEDPSSFVEAKDAIEHLYDLVKVEEAAAASTSAEGASWASTGTQCNDDYEPIVLRPPPLPAPSRQRKQQQEQRGSAAALAAPKSFWLRVRGPKNPTPLRDSPLGERDSGAGAVLCDYAEPRDAPVHIYTEIGPAGMGTRRRPLLQRLQPLFRKGRPGSGASTSLAPSTPICDYSEPNDSQVHLYAEIMPSATPPPPPPAR